MAYITHPMRSSTRTETLAWLGLSAPPELRPVLTWPAIYSASLEDLEAALTVTLEGVFQAADAEMRQDESYKMRGGGGSTAAGILFIGNRCVVKVDVAVWRTLSHDQGRHVSMPHGHHAARHYCSPTLMVLSMHDRLVCFSLGDSILALQLTTPAGPNPLLFDEHSTRSQAEFERVAANGAK